MGCLSSAPSATRKVLYYVLDEKEADLYRAKIAHNTSLYLLSVVEYAAAAKSALTAVGLSEKTLG